MRRTLLTLLTATAVTFCPISVAHAATGATQNEASSNASSDLDGSSYNQWLDENVATTDNESTNTFLKILVDFLLGIAATIVVGSIYGEIARRL